MGMRLSVLEEKTYWGDRQKRLNKILSKSEAELNRRMKKYYKAEESRVDSLIASYYQKYGENNVIEYRNLLGKLSDKDRELLMRDADAFAQTYPQYSHLVPVRSSIYRLNRLEGMQTSIQIGQAEIGAKTEEAVRKHLEGISGRAYDEIMKMTGPVGVEREDVIRACVGSNWAGGGNFSDRIWKQKDSLVKALNEDLAAGYARGDTYDQMSKMLKQRFSTSYNEAARLVYTEGTYVLNESTARTVEKDFRYYKTSTAADDKVCEICRNASAGTGAKPVLFTDRQPGFNFPPFHPWCRCSFEIVIPDRQKWIDEYVNSHGGDPALTDEQKRDAADLLKAMGIDVSAEETLNKRGDPVYDIFGSAKDSHPEVISRVMKEAEELNVELKNGKSRMSYSPGLKSGDPGQLILCEEDSVGAWLHEEQHMLDDASDGFPGFEGLFDVARRTKMEYNAYRREVRLARDNKREDVAKELIQSCKEEIESFGGEWDEKKLE